MRARARITPLLVAALLGGGGALAGCGEEDVDQARDDVEQEAQDAQQQGEEAADDAQQQGEEAADDAQQEAEEATDGDGGGG
jgi:cobalamin biosynthesis protein CobT